MRLLTTSIDSKKSKQRIIYSKLALESILQLQKIFLLIMIYNEKELKSSTKTYSLLKDDIKEGCVIPPIVLAIFPKEPNTTFDLTEEKILFRDYQLQVMTY